MAPKAPRKPKTAKPNPEPEETTPPRHIDIKLTTDELKVPLTNDELLKFGDDLAQAQHRFTGLDNEKKDMVSNYKAKLTSCEATISLLSNLLIQKYELRDVECERREDYDQGIITLIRLDTKEVVWQRPMSKNETQRELSLWPIEETTDEEEEAAGETENGTSGDEPPEPPEQQSE